MFDAYWSHVSIPLACSRQYRARLHPTRCATADIRELQATIFAFDAFLANYLFFHFLLTPEKQKNKSAVYRVSYIS